jgi:hypothetical protein
MAIDLADKVISPILLDVRGGRGKAGQNGRDFARTTTESGNVATIPCKTFTNNTDSFIWRFCDLSVLSE